jgi:hypothetical protein
MSALEQLETPPPIILMITLQGVRGASLDVTRQALDDPPKLDRDVLELPEGIIERYGSDADYQRAARPAFDALWNVGGFFRSKNFDTTGEWKPPST